MKNLMVSFCMILFFGFASAQETPVEKKQSTDTSSSQKSKHKTSTQKSTAAKKDTVKTQRTEKKGKTAKSKENTTQQGRDTITRTRP